VRLKIGTRGSQLALFQANAVSALLGANADTECEIVVIKTSGDRLADATIAQIGGKRLFVKEIEDALLAGEVDLAVHSSKDLPVVLPSGLAIGAALPREDARDAIVLPADGARVPASPYAESDEVSARPRQSATNARDRGPRRAARSMSSWRGLAEARESARAASDGRRS
jgi:hydroxymethylbilane synthase